ncbi:LAMI_0F04478g1_1 [Lachancea mirantina]|uniref:LAMI_0F04478g1_1 n=1 Tax=Lachancea mirantina TaxID=1230905 RepID=A0A1G4JXT0_9SACH|nr:LAMI_0F04478g1_1 [Lachancea mirantina]
MAVSEGKRHASDVDGTEGELADSQVTKKLKQESLSGDLKEADVGITNFLRGSNAGFYGQIKQRYTDFMVNEISVANEVIHLLDRGFKMPKVAKPSKEQSNELQEAENRERNSFEVESGVRETLVELLGEEDTVKIEEVYKNAGKMETTKRFDDKAERTKVHQTLRAAFKNELESVTSENNTFKIALANRKSRVNKEELRERTKDENGVENWGYGPTKNFIHFTMYKENKDTMDVANVIAKFLRVPSRLIRYAGTKDRRAITCQKMSISKISLERLNALNRALKGVVLGGFKFEDDPLNLGELNGNEFVIAIREVQISPEASGSDLEGILKKGCDSLMQDGFINYFGMQRFGTFSVSTHEIGRELLSENWKKACDLILAEQENVLPISKEARKVWAETGNAKDALHKMPRQCVAENAILNSLIEQNVEEPNERNFFACINKIPRNLRTMYVHAYQSYVWNVVASKRIELFGLKAVAGDLVIDEEDAELSKPEQVEAEGDEFAEDLRDAKIVRARPITDEEIAAGKFSMEDVVLPTPGFDVVYPTNETLKNVYKETMAPDNISPFEMRRKVRDFSLPGSYRKVINKPEDMSFKIVHYSSPTQQLINTDLEILNNTKAKDNGQKYMKEKLNRFPEDKGGDSVAVLLKFKLSVSAYATMLLRELMKLETSRRGDMCDVRL